MLAPVYGVQARYIQGQDSSAQRCEVADTLAGGSPDNTGHGRGPHSQDEQKQSTLKHRLKYPETRLRWVDRDGG